MRKTILILMAIAGRVMFNGGVNPSANLQLPGKVAELTQD